MAKRSQACFLFILFIAGLFSCRNIFASEPSSTIKPEQKSLILGVFPRRNATLTIKAFNPLANYLTEKTGYKVTLETSHNFETFWHHVEQQRYDIVHFNQLHYIKSSKHGHYTVIAQNEEFGKKNISGAIIVRKDSGIDKIEDLKNKTIIFGGSKQAVIAYVANTAILRNAGLKDGDYKESFAKNPPNSVLSVYYKQADAAGAGDIILDLPTLKNLVDVSKLKLLTTSKPLPHLPWAVKSRLPEALKNSIQNALITLNQSTEGKTILSSATLTGINPAEDKDYLAFRELVTRSESF